eukprot:15458342-Alexandrium_andersonii.AAC.1
MASQKGAQIWCPELCTVVRAEHEHCNENLHGAPEGPAPHGSWSQAFLSHCLPGWRESSGRARIV